MRVGSSPLARGLLAVVVQRLVEGGIIPARAGFTARRHQGGRRHADHPRSRGVYNRRPVHRAATPGSSPLARGLHLEEHSRPPPGGIIPARAGFTPSPSQWGRHRSDHPRSRGVYMMERRTTIVPEGSSPLARGLLPQRGGRLRPPGIIPARAGFTGDHDRGGRHPGDHPRSRGVYRPMSSSMSPTGGSSPLARGLRVLAHARSAHARIIPARAGFTCGSLESQRTRTLPDPCCLHCRPRARSAELR